jgi:asparagine synthetase B (glutamine-hydrolysing)
LVEINDQSIASFSNMHADNIQLLMESLANATRLRVENIPNSPEGGVRLAILFSGGLDCTILASLAHLCIPEHEPIDLLNVAFENPRVNAHHQSTDPYAVPDRKTAVQGFHELQKIYKRQWRLVEINVPYSEALAHKSRIASLMHPCNTVMDLSISMAFWFASRGVGTWNASPYTSDAKVLLSGLGADEQMGGYSRHRVSFVTKSWPGLLDEIQLDVSRISKRNLGRDCRIIGDHGKEVRFPYLDDQVVTFLSGLPIYCKTDPRLPRGDKLILRLVAAALYLPLTSGEAKRAIQFGARTAKMEFNEKGQRDKGQDILPTLKRQS